jgi:hypothetical protein
MKIDKKKQEPGFIQIEKMDLGNFTDVALLVDNIYFREEVERMRLKYKHLYDFPLKDKKVIDDFVTKRIIDQKLKGQFEADLERIRKYFDRPCHFLPVIESSVVYGFVCGSDYSKAYLEEQETFPDDNPDSIPDKKYCIVIHAGTREDDIIRVFREFEMKKKIHFKGVGNKTRNDNLGYSVDFSFQKMKDTFGSIEDIHNWYISGKKPLEIALEEKGYTPKEFIDLRKKLKSAINEHSEVEQKNYNLDSNKIKRIYSRRDTIKEQMRAYRRLLTSPIL